MVDFTYGASKMKPPTIANNTKPRETPGIVNDTTPRFPKACKTQMFTRHEQIWLDVTNNMIKAGRTGSYSAHEAGIVLEKFIEKFEKD